MSKRGSNSEPFVQENDALTARPQLHEVMLIVKLETLSFDDVIVLILILNFS